MEEKILTEAENWKFEGEAVINDIKNHVKNIELATGTNQYIYFNLTTNEDGKYHVELSGNGFRIVGNDYDTKNIENEQYFETPYSLLGSISESFSKSFGNELFQKLIALQKKREAGEDDSYTTDDDDDDDEAGDRCA